MKKNRLVLSDAAVADIIEQAEWYSTQSATALAGRRALGEGSHLRHTARSESPDNGSAVHISIFGTPQCATNCDSGIPQASAFFYRVDSGEIFVLRVVRGARDLERLS